MWSGSACVVSRCVTVRPSRSTASNKGSSGAPESTKTAVPPGSSAIMYAFESQSGCMLRSTITVLYRRNLTDGATACILAAVNDGGMLSARRGTSLRQIATVHEFGALVGVAPDAGQERAIRVFLVADVCLYRESLAEALAERVAALNIVAPRGNGSRKLTRRQREIAALISEGLSNKQIAHRLSIQRATVKNHVHNIFAALGLSHRDEVAALIRTSLLG